MDIQLSDQAKNLTLATLPAKSSFLIRNDQEWDYLKDEIRRLYMIEDNTLVATMRKIEEKYSFKASKRKWKMKLKEWSFKKYLPSADMSIIVAKAEKRASDEGKETIFFHNETQIAYEKIEHFKRKKNTNAAEAASPSAETPSSITYHTPSPNLATRFFKIPAKQVDISKSGPDIHEPSDKENLASRIPESRSMSPVLFGTWPKGYSNITDTSETTLSPVTTTTKAFQTLDATHLSLFQALPGHAAVFMGDVNLHSELQQNIGTLFVDEAVRGQLSGECVVSEADIPSTTSPASPSLQLDIMLSPYGHYAPETALNSTMSVATTEKAVAPAPAQHNYSLQQKVFEYLATFPSNYPTSVYEGIRCIYDLACVLEKGNKHKSAALHYHHAIDAFANLAATGYFDPEGRKKFALIELSYYPVSSLVCTPTECLLELRLFYHYMEMISQKSIMCPVWKHETDSQPCLCRWITALALKTPCLMDALLGISAFHLRFLDANDTTVLEASHKYMRRAIAEHTRQMHEGVNANNSEVLFAASVFMSFHAACVQRDLFGNTPESILPLHWFHPWRGASAIAKAGWQYFKSDFVKEWIQHEAFLYHGFELAQDDPAQETFTFLLAGLDTGEIDSDTVKAYESSVVDLSKIYAIPAPRHILKFPVLVSPRFIELLTVQDPRTLTIVGYFFMLLKRLDHVWWIQGAADREFKNLMGLLPEEWKSRMDWAVREFESR